MSGPAIDPRSTRRKRLALASLATLVATLWAAMQGDDATPVGPPVRASTSGSGASSPRRAASTMPVLASAWPAPPDAAVRVPWHPALPQGVVAWSGPPQASPPPPPTPAVARDAAAATPEAPPFPYTLIGRLDDGEPRALLSGPLRSFGVKADEVIDGQWHVDAVLPNGVTLTWLPGSVKKTLTFAAS